MFERYARLAVLIVASLLGGFATGAQGDRHAGPPPEKAVPAKGMFLVAGRGMPDPRFRHTVLLLVRHDSRGTLGVVVNRPTRFPLSHLRPELAGQERTVYYGGPVSPDVLLFLSRSKTMPPRTERVIDDIYAGGSRATLKELLAAGGGGERLRIYAGHAGWAVGQLEAELERGDWFLAPGDPAAVFSSDPDALWPRLIDALDPDGILVRANSRETAL